MIPKYSDPIMTLIKWRGRDRVLGKNLAMKIMLGVGVDHAEFEQQHEETTRLVAEKIREFGVPKGWKDLKARVNTLVAPDAHLGATEES